MVDTHPVIELEGGLNYQGRLEKGLPHGYGKLIWPNGDYYQGEFRYGKRNGMGKRVNVDGSEYQGQYLDDKPNGRGLYVWKDGESYEGEWFEGKFEGNGVKTLPDGTIFDGQWIEGKPNGFGMCKYPDTAKYTGNWENGQPHGQGVKILPDGTKYTGDWIEGKAAGLGVKQLPNGTIYDGKWIDGKFEEGKCTYPDGKIYEGRWKDGKPNGKGIKTWSDGRQYDGLWRAGKPYGFGKKVYPDGKFKEGYWEKEKFREGQPPEGFQENLENEMDQDPAQRNEVDDVHEPQGIRLEQNVPAPLKIKTPLGKKLPPKTQPQNQKQPYIASEQQPPQSQQPPVLTQTSLYQQNESQKPGQYQGVINSPKALSEASQPISFQINKANSQLPKKKDQQQQKKQELLEQQRLEKERLMQQQMEEQRKLEEQQREYLRLEKLEDERIERERVERESQAKQEREQNQREMEEKIKQQKAQEEKDRLIKQKKEREEKEKNQREIKELEKYEKERKDKEERDKRYKNFMDKQRQEQQELQERQREEQQRLEMVQQEETQQFVTDGVHEPSSAGHQSQNERAESKERSDNLLNMIPSTRRSQQNHQDQKKIAQPIKNQSSKSQNRQKQLTYNEVVGESDNYQPDVQSRSNFSKSSSPNPSKKPNPADPKFYIDEEGYVQFPDGSRYKGSLKMGNPEGVGIIIYADGSKYEGDWKQGASHGFGILSFQDKSRYEGHWYRGKYNGKGVYETGTGAKYDGEWQNGKYHGVGTFHWPDGSVYKGEWRTCRENGKGKFTGVNGTVYEGEWKDGKYNGKGKLITPDGKILPQIPQSHLEFSSIQNNDNQSHINFDMRPATGQVYNNQNNNAGWQFQNMNGNQAHHQVNGMLGFPQNMARPHTAAQINQNGYFMGHYSQFNNMQQNRPQNFGQVPAQYQHILQPEAFQCSCGLQLHRKEIPHHFNQCQAIHQKYENVYKAISSQFECSNSPQEFKNLQHMLLSFADRAQELSRMNGKIQNQQQQVSQNQDQLFQCIQSNPIQPQINPLQQQQAQINPISYQKNMQMPLQQLPPQSQKQLFGFQEQMPTSQRNTFSLNNNNQYDNHQPRHTDVIVNEVNLLDNIENQIPQQNINNDKQGGLSNLFVEMEDEEDKEQFLNQTTPLEQCSICLIEIKKQDEEIVLESCFHYCHRSCLVQYVMQEYPKGQGVNCPRCGKGVSEREFRQQFSDEQKRQFEKLEQQLLKEGMGENFVQCSCGNGMFIEEGEPDYNQKDEMGQKISREAAEHMSKYRVRCNECNKVFCSECRIEPYHLGKTCEQFKDFKQSKKCRYCWEKMSEPSISPHEALQDVCRKQECIAIMKQACTKMLPNCGHPCSGFANEPRCLPCLDPECVKKDESITLGEDSSSYCSICAICGLGDLPSVQLDCKHIFHLDCIKQKLQKRWPGPRIVFSYLNCTCKKRIKATYCQELTTIVKQARKFEKEIKKKAIERGKYENLEKDAKLKDKFIDPNHRFYKNFDLMCMESLSYYECFECKQAYFGGQKNCENANEEAKGEFKPQELVCGRCSAKNVGMGEQNCKKHGMDYIEFKCKFCCDIAQWFCWGNTHFCEKCHTRQNNGDYVSRKPKSDLPKCPGEEKCPLRVKHPANGEEFSLGCSICRNEKQNVKNF